MSRVISLEVLAVREHPFRADRIQVKVKIPQTGGFDSEEWFEPNMHEMKRRFRPQGGNYEHLVGKYLRIPELEREAEKAGYRINRQRRWRG